MSRKKYTLPLDVLPLIILPVFLPLNGVIGHSKNYKKKKYHE
jgi:hypothetical protein